MSTELTLYRRSELEAVRDSCLHRFKTLWLDGVDDSSDIALVGIGLHRIKFEYLNRLREYGVESDSDLAREAFTAGAAAAQSPSHILPEMRQLWERHAEHYEMNLSGYVTHEERQESGGRSFTPDLVTANPRINELEIHDDKWGWNPPLSEDELKVLFQARVYTLLGKERWPGFSSYRFTIHACRFGVATSVVFTEQELDEIEREVKALIAIVEHAKAINSWPAIAGPGCKWCRLVCPLETPASLPKRFTDMQVAQNIGGWILAMEGQLKQAKRTLKEFVSAHGPVDVQGVKWDNRKSTTTLYPVPVVMEVLKLKGLSGAFEDANQSALTISKSALSKLMKQFPDLESDLAKYAISKPVYRFAARQPGVDDDADE